MGGNKGAIKFQVINVHASKEFIKGLIKVCDEGVVRLPGLVGLFSEAGDEGTFKEMLDSLRYEEHFKVDSFRSPPFMAGRVHLGVFNREKQPFFNQKGDKLLFLYRGFFWWHRRNWFF